MRSRSRIVGSSSEYPTRPCRDTNDQANAWCSRYGSADPCRRRRGAPGAGAPTGGQSLVSERDAILDLGDARRQPCGPLRFITFRPRAHAALQDDFAAVGFHGDVIRVELCNALQSALNLLLDFHRADPRCKFYEVADANHAFDP